MQTSEGFTQPCAILRASLQDKAFLVVHLQIALTSATLYKSLHVAISSHGFHVTSNVIALAPKVLEYDVKLLFITQQLFPFQA